MNLHLNNVNDQQNVTIPDILKQVLIQGVDEAVNGEDTTGFLGYCPQENALWSNLTVKEHLEMYAVVKGIQKDAAAVAINQYGLAKDPAFIVQIKSQRFG